MGRNGRCLNSDRVWRCGSEREHHIERTEAGEGDTRGELSDVFCRPRTLQGQSQWQISH